jgi:hypothetical protein
VQIRREGAVRKEAEEEKGRGKTRADRKRGKAEERRWEQIRGRDCEGGIRGESGSKC